MYVHDICMTTKIYRNPDTNDIGTELGLFD
jgi:hypothetical protein